MAARLAFLAFPLLGATIMAQIEGLKFGPPETQTGWMGVLLALILGIGWVIDRRKLQLADTNKAIVAEKENLIASHERMISHLQESAASWEKEAKHFRIEFESLREINHALRNYANECAMRLVINKVDPPVMPESLATP